MHIEARLEEISNTLKAIHTALASGAAIPAATPAAAPAAASKSTKSTKPETPAATPAAAPTPPAAAAPAEAALDFDKDVMPVIKALNTSKEPGRGRDGVLALLKHFGLDGSEGKRVPNLAALDKHAEVKAAAESLLKTGALPAAAGDDDLGLGI